MRLLESCVSPGAKLAVGLAAFSGLRPGQVRELVFQNLVEFSAAGRQFSQVPSRIELRNRSFWKYYTFLSTSGCRHLLDDLSMRSQPISSKEQVVTVRAFAEADRILRAAKLRWFELRHYFLGSCDWVEQQYRALPHEAIHFMLGYVVKEDDLTHVLYFFEPKAIGFLRNGYVEVEKQFFA